jgi:hypothetical protein
MNRKLSLPSTANNVRPNRFFADGVGRKTGWKQTRNIPMDQDGMENVDAFFDSSIIHEPHRNIDEDSYCVEEYFEPEEYYEVDEEEEIHEELLNENMSRTFSPIIQRSPLIHNLPFVAHRTLVKRTPPTQNRQKVVQLSRSNNRRASIQYSDNDQTLQPLSRNHSNQYIDDQSNSARLPASKTNRTKIQSPSLQFRRNSLPANSYLNEQQPIRDDKQRFIRSRSPSTFVRRIEYEQQPHQLVERPSRDQILLTRRSANGREFDDENEIIEYGDNDRGYVSTRSGYIDEYAEPANKAYYRVDGRNHGYEVDQDDDRVIRKVYDNRQFDNDHNDSVVDHEEYEDTQRIQYPNNKIVSRMGKKGSSLNNNAEKRLNGTDERRRSQVSDRRQEFEIDHEIDRVLDDEYENKETLQSSKKKGKTAAIRKNQKPILEIEPQNDNDVNLKRKKSIKGGRSTRINSSPEAATKFVAISPSVELVSQYTPKKQTPLRTEIFVAESDESTVESSDEAKNNVNGLQLNDESNDQCDNLNEFDQHDEQNVEHYSQEDDHESLPESSTIKKGKYLILIKMSVKKM